MDEEKLKEAVASEPTSTEATDSNPVVDERPNRTAFAKRFSGRHKDVDFEDKEARYGALSEDADRLDKYEKSGRALSGVFEKHRWLANMLEALREDDELDPVTWMADKGIDINEALWDEDYRKTISERIATYQKRMVAGEEAEKEREKNLKKSADALGSLGKSDEECITMWNKLFDDIIDPALRGEVKKDTWELIAKALNYDKDVEAAGQAGAMRARNEKIRNKKNEAPAGLPPSLPQGGVGSVQTASRKKKSFFDGIEGMS